MCGGGTDLYRHVVFLCSVIIAVLSAASAALAADSERCQELGRKFRTAKLQITAIEVSLALFSAVDGNCIGLATELLIGIGGSLAAPPLPHHRTYGSVYGGS